MSLSNRVHSLIDVLLRVPPLFVIDELFRMGLGLPQGKLSTASQEQTNPPEYQTQAAKHIFQYDAQFYKLFFFVLVKLVLSCLGCFAALVTFSLGKKYLRIVYLFVISAGIVFVSYWGNVTTIRSITTVLGPGRHSILESFLLLDYQTLFSLDGVGVTLIENYVAQLGLAYVFSCVHLGPRYPWLQKLWPVAFLAPSILCLLPLPTEFLNHVPVFAALFPLAILKLALWTSAFSIMGSLESACTSYRMRIRIYGLTAVMEAEWIRLNVPCVLRTFWILRLIEQAFAYQLPTGLDFVSLVDLCKSLLISGCETLTAVLGMTSVISYGCHYIGCFFQWILLIDDDDDKSMGTVSAILFYILALQTGLTSLEPDKRFIRLCRNFCLLFTALLHFIHNIVNPLLMSLSASHNPSLHRHLRALTVCTFLIVYPMGLLVYLWSQQPMSTWLLAVSAFSLEVIVKVVVSLLIYALFLIDAYRSTFWEKLDDYVYYIRAFGNTVEFCFGIFLFFNGAWILVFESGSAIRAGMMGIHAYFNIWCEARIGWLVFMKRRTAVNKIESLPEASEAQLANLDDVCAICYQEMRSAKITRCNHFFHGVCLRKWLYVQDRCPLCHDILYKVENDKDNETNVRETMEMQIAEGR